MNKDLNQDSIGQIQLNYNNIPVAVFLLGPNGSGKSSLRRYLDLSDIQTNIDPDMLNRVYKDKFPNTYTVAAAKKALMMYDDGLKNGLNICLESTLAGHGTMLRIMAAKKLGYYTIAYYIGLNSVELNLERIALRVLHGGHDIPEDKVRKRFTESGQNLIKSKNSFDEIHIIDNSGKYFQLQHSIVQNKIIQYKTPKEEWANKLFKDLKDESM